MTDILSEEERSRLMANVRTEDTKPETVVQAILNEVVEYKTHVESLPGSPDIVMPDLRQVIFVHGCFWHQHEGCQKAKRPESNTEFWDEKLSRNCERDSRQVQQLTKMEWQCMTIWECETEDDLEALSERVLAFVGQE